jgi:hypothetical protein
MLFAKPIAKVVLFLICGLLVPGLAALSYEAAPAKAKSQLELARENLRISEATQRRIAAELDKLKKSGQASAEVINDYEIYLARVQAMVAENRKVVSGMEAAYAGNLPQKSTSGQNTSSEIDSMLNPAIPEEQANDEVAALDREFNTSLAEFDEMLLKEFAAIRAKSNQKMRDLAEEAAAAARRLREKGVDLNTGESESSAEGQEGTEEGEGKEGTAEAGKESEAEKSGEEKGERAEGEADASDKKEGAESKEAGKDTQVATRDKSGDKGQGTTTDRGSRYSKEDDDIVARQLREAAENETDPELKEKLWREYEEYKKNTQ